MALDLKKISKYGFYGLVIAVAIYALFELAVFLIFSVALMQLGNTDVRFQNQYYLPQFSYGYLIDRTHQKSATLYVSIEPGVNPLDAQLLDCKNDCQPERLPYLSTRRADCTQANERDKNDPNCASAEFQLIKRHDGKKQWAYQGKLLYYYPNQKVNGGWWQPDIEDLKSKPGWRPVQSMFFYEDKLVNSTGQNIYQLQNQATCSKTHLLDMAPFLITNEYTFNIRSAGPTGELEIDERQKQWTFADKPLYVAQAVSSQVKTQDSLADASCLREISFQPGFATRPSEKNLKSTESNLLNPQKNYFYNFRGQFLVIPKNKKQAEEVCLGECQEYFVPYLVEEDSTRQARIGDFTVQQYQVNQRQWHYKNQPVFILVNSYGWPFLDKLEEFNMRLISP